MSSEPTGGIEQQLFREERLAVGRDTVNVVSLGRGPAVAANVEAHVIGECGHYPAQEQPAQWRELVRPFLAGAT